ncbi:MAG: SDR family oxidoreductase [Thermoleophilaceae bacterium]
MPTLNERGALLLTGATGFVGMEVLARYLERGDQRIYALVRAAGQEDADGRLRQTLAAATGSAEDWDDRVSAVPGDIEQPDLGLDPERRDELAGEVSDVLHVAASVSFSLSIEQSRQINVEGTRRLLEFAERCDELGGLRRFSYVSTAYVAGDHEGDFHEEQLDVGQGFRNPYERSKFEAEQLIDAWRERLPIQVFRPSIIVGERDTGWTPAFNVLYTPLKAFSRGAFRAVPAEREAPVDVVPVDYVADAIFELASSDGAALETYHLVAGSRATTVGRLVQLSADYFSRRAPVLLPPRLYDRLVHPVLLRLTRGRRKRVLERTEVFFPYFSMRVRYDDRRARGRLEPAGIRVTPVESYFGRLADFAVGTHWGRAMVDRVQARRDRTPVGS